MIIKIAFKVQYVKESRTDGLLVAIIYFSYYQNDLKAIKFVRLISF